MEKLSLEVNKIDCGLRLDQYIINQLKLSVSRSQIQRLIKAGKILVNQQPSKAHYKVKENDVLSVNIPKLIPPEVLPEQIPLDIIFEDESLLVINKPAGMVTHPAGNNYAHTLVNALLNYGCQLSTVNGFLRPGIVHRLDKDTSGLIVVAKTDSAHQKLAEQFRNRTVKRKYLAIVKGKVSHDEGQINLPLARDVQNRRKITVSFLEKSRDALTRYRVLKRYKDVSFLELAPQTGRTHQLRVHLKFCGHPILGDTKYAKGSGFGRMALHAAELGFNHPRTGKFVEFHSNLPEIFENFLSSLK